MTFKQALNDVIRQGAAPSEPGAFSTRTASMGRSKVSVDRALQLAAVLEDDELIRRMQEGE